MENTQYRKDLSDQLDERVHFVNKEILKVGLEEIVEVHDHVSSFIVSVEAEMKAKGQDYFRYKAAEERVKLVKEKFIWVSPQPKPPEILKKYEKNSDTSKLLRDHGNSLFRQRKFEDALHYYNLALLFGLDESVGMAYANRAAVLMELDDPAGALEDIDLALKHEYPASRTQKLDERKLKCVQMIEKKASEDAVIKPLIDEERIELNKLQDSFSRIAKRNPRAPAAAEFVEIKFDETYGRKLVVTRDVSPGTLLLVEDPFVCVLEGQLHWDTEHCHHCFKRIRRGIPCEKCTFAFYCSEACLKKSMKSTHGLECSIMSYLHLARIPDVTYEALKMICKVGSAELYRLFTTRDPDFFNRKQAFGTAPEDKYESDSYLSVYHLESHPESLDLVKQYVHVYQALLMTEYLSIGTTFFESIPKYHMKEFTNLVAALMVHHIESHKTNAAVLTEFNGLEDLTLETVLRQRTNKPERRESFQTQIFATGMYPLFSLMNHSCDPNATYFFHKTNGTMSVVAQRSIKKGEQIFVSYVVSFFRNAKKNRQEELRVYNFDCTCLACRNNWPTLDKVATGSRVSCSACSKTFSHDETDSEEFLKCQLSQPLWTCGRCGQRYHLPELSNRYQINMKLSGEAYNMLLLRGDPGEALRMAIKLIEYFQYALIPPERATYSLQELLMYSLLFLSQLRL